MLVMSTNFLFSKVCWQRPAMFCLCTSIKLSHPLFEFSLKVKVMRSDPGYLLKSFLRYNSSINWSSEHTVINWNLSTVRFSDIRFTPFVLSLHNKPAVIWDWYLQDQGVRKREFCNTLVSIKTLIHICFDFSNKLKTEQFEFSCLMIVLVAWNKL